MQRFNAAGLPTYVILRPKVRSSTDYADHTDSDTDRAGSSVRGKDSTSGGAAQPR